MSLGMRWMVVDDERQDSSSNIGDRCRMRKGGDHDKIIS